MIVRKSMRDVLLKVLGVFPYKISISSNIEYLKRNGLIIGKNFSMMQGCIIDDSHCWMISIGDNVTLAPNVHVLAHDASTKPIVGYTRIARTSIGNNVFVGAGSIILPGVTIGDNVVIGAGSIVSKNIPDGVVVCGNEVVKTYEQYADEKRNEFKKCQEGGKVYDRSYTILEDPSMDKRIQMRENENGFVV